MDKNKVLFGKKKAIWYSVKLVYSLLFLFFMHKQIKDKTGLRKKKHIKIEWLSQ